MGGLELSVCVVYPEVQQKKGHDLPRTPSENV